MQLWTIRKSKLLNKVTNFTGIEGVHTTTAEGVPAVDMDPHTTKRVASERIQQMHFTASIPTPSYYDTRTEDDWNKMEPWFRELFHTTHTPKPQQRYEHIMNEVGMKELMFRIKRLKKNKAGGRSRVTADLLQLLDEDTVREWLMPLINRCLADEDLPPSAKLFAVWAIEKVPGAGSIITSSGKLNIRPITLLEPTFKLIEAIIHSRLQKAMSKAGALNPNHYGFTHGTGSDDLMMEESMLCEDANQHRKEIHVSNNDCTAAYDSITMWGSETIYKYHGLPPNLIRFMLNIDKHQQGHVLTAHGASEDFEKNCGLGQGSILAPLKWKLFLDPLLKKLDQTGEPYIMGTGANTVHIYAAAFADDLTVVAPTHKDYVLRMELTNKYLSFFGVELNAVKTTYTYANTVHHHHPINIWNRHSHTTAPSSVAAPTQALRYLGGWLSPSMRSKKGKTMLLAGIHSILNVLQYKKLDWKEYRYIIQAVVESKAMYYLNVAPLTDAELFTLDRRIAAQFKRTLKMARSSSSHILYLPESEKGFALPSIKQRRDALLLRQAYRLLNDPGHLGKVFRTRLNDYKLVTGDTSNPLNKPVTHSKLFNNHWFARIAHILHTNGHKITTTLNMATPQGRATDTPLINALTPSIHRDLLPHLLAHNLTWVGDVADATGTRVRTMKKRNRNGTPEWWVKLTEALTHPHSTRLIKGVSPTQDPMFTPTKHKVGDIVFLPNEDDTGRFKSPSEGHYFKVLGHNTDTDNRPTCTLIQLTPLRHTPGYTSNHITESFHKVTNCSVLLYANPITRQEQHVDGDLLSVKYLTQRVSTRYSPRGPRGKKHVQMNNTTTFPTVYLINPHHYIKTSETTITGPTPIKLLADHQERLISSIQRNEDGDAVVTTDTQPHAPCAKCGRTNTDTKCANTPSCEAWFHARCIPHSQLCPACQHPRDTHTAPTQLTQVELLTLHNACGTIYSSTDGSVKGIHKTDVSSTWGLCIRVQAQDGTITRITRHGKILITAGEESSYRVEVEGLIQIYALLPAAFHTTHACDNEAAVDAHDTIDYHARKGARKWATTDYRTALDRLLQAIDRRGGTKLDVVHTHSHLEHQHTDDTALRIRRDTLAEADTQADSGHTLPGTLCTPSHRELFTVHSHRGPLEKNVGAATLTHMVQQKKTQLASLPMEGALLKHMHDSIPTAKRTSLPDHLLIFRTKVILNRLPTRQERNRRKDTHADGSLITADCPHCPGTVESHVHALAQCTATRHLLPKLLYRANQAIRNTASTLHKRGTSDAAWLQSLLQRQHTHTFTLKQGWKTTLTDKHGRVTPTGHGPDRVGVLEDQEHYTQHSSEIEFATRTPVLK